jgi:hypothetical protein
MEFFNTEYFSTRITDLLLEKVYPERRKSHAPLLNVHLDNCWVHSSNASKNFSAFSVTVPHHPYSPELTRSDFWLSTYNRNEGHNSRERGRISGQGMARSDSGRELTVNCIIIIGLLWKGRVYLPEA